MTTIPEYRPVGPYIILGALCHAYEHLLDHLDAFDEAVQSREDWDAHRLVSQCINQAARLFGRSSIGTENASALCADLMRRIRGLLDAELPGDSPVFPVFEACQRSMGTTPPSSIDLAKYQQTGERLSRDCHLQVVAFGDPTLSRSAELIIEPHNSQRLKSLPQKQGGISKIIFEFATHEFTFDTFVNLPFYFFHEYFSHIHSAEMYAERFGNPAVFEDGWLLYAAHQFYRQKLMDTSYSSKISYPEYRRFYAGAYVNEATSLEKSRSVRSGYYLAENFETLGGADRFWNLTLKLASTPYNHLPDHVDLQNELLIQLKPWVRRITNMEPAQRDESFDLFDLALHDTVDPLKELFDVVV